MSKKSIKKINRFINNYGEILRFVIKCIVDYIEK